MLPFNRTLSVLVGISCLLGASTSLRAAKAKLSADAINISEGWKFKVDADDASWASPSFDHSDWADMKTHATWENLGYKDFVGIGWSRLQVVIPESLKAKQHGIESLTLELGRIGDADQTYFNGQLVGESGRFPPKPGSAIWEFRKYILKNSDVLWGQTNTVAVRVHDNGNNGGFIEGPYGIRPTRLTDLISFDAAMDSTDAQPLPNGPVERSLTIKNPTAQTYAGELSIKVTNLSSKAVVFESASPLSLPAGQSTASSYEFPVEVPGVYQATYTYTLAGSDGQEFIRKTPLVALINQPRAQQTELQIVAPLVDNTIPEKSSLLSIKGQNLSGLLDSKIDQNLEMRLLRVDHTGILEGFYQRPGKHKWIGEHVGKFLHAATDTWTYTRNPELKAKMDTAVDVLLATQMEDGYLGTYLPEDHWTSWDVWSHKYNLIGLLAYYEATGYQPALEASKQIGDLLCETFGEGDGQLTISLTGTHVGLAPCSVLEPMTYLYRFTGDTKYLDFCNYIVKSYDADGGPAVISTLLSNGQVNETANAKAYELLTNLVGVIKLYQLTGNDELLQACLNAWNDVVAKRMYITGTMSEHEYFKDDYFLPAENRNHMGEGCVTTTWIQMNKALYEVTGEMKYMDEVERATYNHLLGAQNPLTGNVSYYTALNGKKKYGGHIACCTSSVPRGIAFIPELVGATNQDDGFALNFYEPGTIVAEVASNVSTPIALKLAVMSKSPASDRFDCEMSLSEPARFPLSLRVPYWCENYTVRIDGETLEGTPGEYLVLDRQWGAKTQLTIEMDLKPRILRDAKNYPDCVAIQYGPHVLALDSTVNSECGKLDQITVKPDQLNFKIANGTGLDPWHGSFVFAVDGRLQIGNEKVTLKFVPFADASQTQGDVRVWIKSK